MNMSSNSNVYLFSFKTFQVLSECNLVDWEILWQPNMKVIWKDGATFRSVNAGFDALYHWPVYLYCDKVTTS